MYMSIKKTKYVVITGGVMSGIGKGIVTASIGKILQSLNKKVTIIKIDPYLNWDAGTMNPFQHGEVFVTIDGVELDCDFGHYERMLDLQLLGNQNITTGQVYYEVISRERRGDFLGETVQIIPHITDEIKRRINLVAERSGAEVVIIEVGGTVGDIEGLPFLEAVRQLSLEVGRYNCLFVHVTFVPFPTHLREPKTKPTQHSVKELRSIGIDPSFIVCRSENPVGKGPRRKIALFCNVEERAVFTLPDLDVVYEAPLVLDGQGLGQMIPEYLDFEEKKPALLEWKETVDSFKNFEGEITIGMIGKYAELADSYISINESLKHAGAVLKRRVNIDWVNSEDFEKDPYAIERLGKYAGILIPGGFGARGTEGKILAIKFARENNVPFLGICFGMQLATVEFARNMAGLEGANSTELDQESPHPVICILPEQVNVKNKGGTMRLGGYTAVITPETKAYELYKTEKIVRRHRHRFEVNPEYIQILEKNGLVFSGRSEDGRLMEILELPNHPFFFGTQFHPEFDSRPAKPEPAYLGFIKAAVERELKTKIIESTP